MKWVTFGSLQATDVFVDFKFKNHFETDFAASKEFNGLGTFSYALQEAGAQVKEFRVIPFSNLNWSLRKKACSVLLDLENSSPQLAIKRGQEVTKSFLEWIKKDQFDGFFTREPFTMLPEQLKELSKSVKIRVLWLSWSPGRKQGPAYHDYLKHFTHIFLIDKLGVQELKKEGYNAYYLPLALSDFCIDESVQKKQKSVGFIGTIYPDRMKLLSRLAEHDFSFWSPNFEAGTKIMYPQMCDFYRGVAWGEKMLDALASIQVLVNPVHRGYMMGIEDDVTNFRNFESIGSHTFQISEDKPAIREIFEEDEIAYYSSTEDLMEKLDYYLKHEEIQKNMLKKARKKVLKSHLYSHRMQEILQIVSK
ncbi:glycosyltransferase [bacterium]|nr:glycosyltransferase [bacterium]